VTIGSDASGSLEGGYSYRVLAPPGVLPAHLDNVCFVGSFSPEHARKNAANIAVGELWAPLEALTRCGPYLRNRSVRILIDNQSDKDIINRWSTRSDSSGDLATLLRALSALAVQYNIRIQAEWLSTDANLLQDFASRLALHKGRPTDTFPAFAAAHDLPLSERPREFAFTHSHLLTVPEWLDPECDPLMITPQWSGE
jgi:hypothetical protein